MGLLDQIKADIAQITGNTDDFGTPLTFEAPSGDTAIVNGLASRHHLSFDTDGNTVNGRNVHVSVSETNMIAAELMVRNSAGEVSIKNWKVSWTDATGTLKKYIIRECYPDDTIGLIVCILGDFK